MKKKDKKSRAPDPKDARLEAFREEADAGFLTTDQGVRIEHTDDSLKAGPRGPTLMEDFHLREKIMRFDHERIPERVVHARGAGAHGHFQVYEPLGEWTRAAFLNDPGVKTPVFVRFSTVAGSRGSADTARDVRGFATKFHTTEGNFDLVGNNMPVFFIQDGIKFPDLIHAVKPEAPNEIPQAQSAHDTFWDFVGLVPETAHMIMWVMSDRAIPRSFSRMEGFGVHTYRLVNAAGRSVFVKFHWKPLLGMHSLVWDEAQELAGRDPDFHRRDLWDSIERGQFPEYELGLQVVEESEADSLGMDLLDPTKLIPEERVPVQRVGKMVLDRNPDNYFAETEQVAYCVGNLVPGIDVTNDPLLQARLFSYLDTQLSRLGGPNFHEIPINRPIVPVMNNQVDGHMRTGLPTRTALYHPSSLDGDGAPALAKGSEGGFVHYPEKVSGTKARIRAKSFGDHFSQATLFYRSLTAPEQLHLTQALQFELGHVERREVRERVVNEILQKIDADLAAAVARDIGVAVPPRSKSARRESATSPALSMANTVKDTILGRKVAVLAASGVDGNAVEELRKSLEKAGAVVELVAPSLATLETKGGAPLEPLRSLLGFGSVLYDAVLVPGGRASVDALADDSKAQMFVKQAFDHFKPIGLLDEAVELVAASGIVASIGDAKGGVFSDHGLVVGSGGNVRGFAKAFMTAVAEHRHWGRPV